MSVLFIKLYSKLRSTTNSNFRSFPLCLRQFSLWNKAPSRNLTNKSTFVRPFFSQLFPKPTAAKLKIEDGIPEAYDIIYKNSMGLYMLMGSVVSTGSLAIVVLWILYLSVTEDTKKLSLATYEGQDQWGDGYQPKPKENELLLLVSLLCMFAVGLQIMVTSMPLRIYNLPEMGKYIFIFYGKLPATKTCVSCNLNEVRKIKAGNLLPWSDSKYEINNKRKIIMLENSFRRPADLNIMLGYEKPDF